MPSRYKTVEEFVAAVRRLKNRHRLWTTLVWTVAVAAALLVAVGLCYILRGYSIPGAWIALIVAVASLAGASLWIARRLNIEGASRFADRFFSLHDAATSYLHFASRGCRDGYYALQAQQTTERIAQLDSSEIRYRPPKRLLCLAVGLVAVAIPISLCPPSDAVLDQLELEKRIELETAAIKGDLVKEAEKLIEETRDKEEQKLLEPDKLRRWVDELKSTKDRTEALRQLARLERKLNEKRQSLKRKQDEQLLERAAEELAKAEETKPMAETLARKDFDKAAEKLKDLKPDKAKSQDQKRRDLAKLKAIAQRMAQAAQSAKPANQGKGKTGKPSDNSKASSKQGQCSANGNNTGKESGECGEPGEGELADTIAELADAAEGCDKSDGTKKDGLCEQVDKLSDQLKKLAMCRRADARLCKLCRSRGKCQSQCQSNMSCASPNAGGHKAGWGSNTSRRNERDALVDNGQTTELKGIKGSGPSITAVESADSGSGVASRRETAKQRNFKHQCESFVQREDVPEVVKDGVKQYFEIIHDVDTERPSKKDRKE